MENINRLLAGKVVLVTGSAGFIGSNLCEYLLQAGHKVVGLDNFSTGKPENIATLCQFNQFTFIEGDIREMSTCAEAVKGVDIVLHQAALGSVPRSVKDPATSNAVNVSGFLNMLEASRLQGIKRFVYASSSSVYGDADYSPKYEGKEGSLLSPYAVTKATNELYASVFARLHGMECVGLRYFNVFGRRQNPDGEYAAVIPRFVKHLLQGQSPQIFGDGEQSRDFTYIDNVIQANLLAATASTPEAVNTVYNIACGGNISLNKLFSLMQRLLAIHQPQVAELSPIYTHERPGDIKHSLADISRACKLLGYQPVFNVEEGLKAAIDWYRTHLK